MTNRERSLFSIGSLLIAAIVFLLILISLR